MEDKKYPCRTEKISGTTYIIKMFIIGETEYRLSTSRESKEEAESYVDRFTKKYPDKYRFEITESSWTSDVCVECGREEY